jgi:hypothetical protein
MTNMTQADEMVIKADVLGRMRTSRERREQLLDEFEKGGLTGQKFAAVVGESQGGGDKNPLALVLALPGGAKVQINDAGQAGLAAELLRALQSSWERPPC